MLEKQMLGIGLVDITQIMIAYAPRGMGSRETIVTEYLYGSYYRRGAVSKSYRTTISRILHKQCDFAPALYAQYCVDYQDLWRCMMDTLRRYPGVARRCIIRDQIAALVDKSNIDADDKLMLQQGYRPDSMAVEDISRYIADVAYYVIRRHK